MTDSLGQMSQNILNTQEKGIFPEKKKKKRSGQCLESMLLCIYLPVTTNYTYWELTVLQTMGRYAICKASSIPYTHSRKRWLRTSPAYKEGTWGRMRFLAVAYAVGKWLSWDSDVNLVPSLWVSEYAHIWRWWSFEEDECYFSFYFQRHLWNSLIIWRECVQNIKVYLAWQNDLKQLVKEKIPISEGHWHRMTVFIVCYI